MANTGDIDLGGPIDVGGEVNVTPAPKTDTWLNAMFQGLTHTFDAFSSYIMGEEAAEQQAFKSTLGAFDLQRIRRNTEREAARVASAGRQFTGSQRTAIAKSGVALSGSAEAALTETDRQFALDVAAIKHSGRLAEIEKESEIEFARIEERASRAIGRAQAVSSILRGAGTYLRAARPTLGRNSTG